MTPCDFLSALTKVSAPCPQDVPACLTMVRDDERYILHEVYSIVLFNLTCKTVCLMQYVPCWLGLYTLNKRIA